MPTPVMQVSENGISLIKSFEAFRAYPYKDSGGKYTIGYGETEGVTALSTPVTEQQASQRLANRVLGFEADVNRIVKVPLNQNQFDALVSLTYEAGTAPLVGTLGQLLNEGQYEAAANEFDKWVFVTLADGTKERSNGLANRRAREKALFLAPVGQVTESQGISI